MHSSGRQRGGAAALDTPRRSRPSSNSRSTPQTFRRNTAMPLAVSSTRSLEAGPIVCTAEASFYDRNARMGSGERLYDAHRAQMPQGDYVSVSLTNRQTFAGSGALSGWGSNSPEQALLVLRLRSAPARLSRCGRRGISQKLFSPRPPRRRFRRSQRRIGQTPARGPCLPGTAPTERAERASRQRAA